MGRGVTACKEAANVQWPKRKWGPSNKGTRSYFSEHVFVEEKFIPLGVREPSEINQRFVHTFRGSGIQLEEVIHDAEFTWHMLTDHQFSDEDLGRLFLTAEMQGIGAARSQSFGRFTVTDFELEPYEPKPRRAPRR